MRERRFAGRISAPSDFPSDSAQPTNRSARIRWKNPIPAGPRAAPLTERQREELLLRTDSQHQPGPENSLTQGEKGTKFRTEAVLLHDFLPWVSCGSTGCGSSHAQPELQLWRFCSAALRRSGATQ